MYSHATPHSSWVFGQNDGGQLGLRGKGRISVPAQLTAWPGGAPIHAARVACGDRHTVVITQDDQVLTCPSNESSNQASISSLLLCQVFVFGTNSYGELGLGFAGAPVSAPARLDSLCGRGVRQVACGDNHTLVYTAEELLYSFGHNSFGQLVRARLPAVLHADTHGTLTHTACCHRVSNTKRMHAALSLWLPCPATRCGLWLVAATMASLSPRQMKRESLQLPALLSYPLTHTPVLASAMCGDAPLKGGWVWASVCGTSGLRNALGPCAASV